MDYMIFFAIWIVGGIAFFLANRVKPGANHSTDAGVVDKEDSKDEEDSDDEDDSEDETEEGESEDSSDEAD